MDYWSQIVSIQSNLDNFFLIIMGIVVFLMQCGFAFLEAGSVRSKNTVNILIKNMLDLLIGGKYFNIYVLGYFSLARSKEHQ